MIGRQLGDYLSLFLIYICTFVCVYEKIYLYTRKANPQRCSLPRVDYPRQTTMMTISPLNDCRTLIKSFIRPTATLNNSSVALEHCLWHMKWLTFG